MRLCDAQCFLIGTAEREVRAQAGGDPDRPHLLFALQRGRHGLFGQRRDGRHRHEAAVAGLEEDVLEVGRIVDRVGGRDQLHGKAAVVDEHLADFAAVEHRLDGAVQPGDRNAEIGCPLTVDPDRQLRLCGRIGEPRLLEARIVLHLGDDLVCRVTELDIAVAQKGELQPASGASYAEAVGLEGEGPHARHLRHQPVDVLHDLLLAALALFPGRQAHHHEAVVLRIARAGDREGRLDFAAVLERLDQRFEFAHLAREIVEADALRCAYPQECKRAVLGRGEFGADRTENAERRDAEQHGGQDDDQRRIERPAEEAAIECGKPVAQPGDEARRRVAVVGALHDARGQHRAQRQRDDR